jgi:hypothetical protein
MVVSMAVRMVCWVWWCKCGMMHVLHLTYASVHLPTASRAAIGNRKHGHGEIAGYICLKHVHPNASGVKHVRTKRIWGRLIFPHRMRYLLGLVAPFALVREIEFYPTCTIGTHVVFHQVLSLLPYSGVTPIKWG